MISFVTRLALLLLGCLPGVALAQVPVFEYQLGSPGAYYTGPAPTQFGSYTLYDRAQPGPDAWRFGYSLFHHVDRAQGHRAAFDARIHVHAGGAPNLFYVGGDLFCFVDAGVVGQCFGGNSYALGFPGVDPRSALVAHEFDVDVRSPVMIRAGIHVSAVSTSIAGGLFRDAAIRIVNQPGALGWQDGILFDDLFTQPIRPGGTVLRATGESLASGVDLSAASFSAGAVRLGEGVRGVIQWEGEGGSSARHYFNAGNAVLEATGAVVIVIKGKPVGYIDSTGRYCRLGGGCTP